MATTVHTYSGNGSMGGLAGSPGPYTFSAEPKTMASARKKYRDSPEKDGGADGHPVNIMHDRRIHRGNTYAVQPTVRENDVDPVELQRQQDAKRRAMARRRAEAQKRPKTPEAVSGRKHADVQTELYLEEILDKMPEANAMTQTDSFMDRPVTPLFIPAKTGVDVETQVLENDLFNFDYEVTPILEVLVGKTIEQGLMEVMEEEELSLIKKNQKNFEQRRNAELAEVQRLEEAEKRRQEEKQRRIEQEKALQQQKRDVAERVAARAFANGYLAGVVPAAVESLATWGYFVDPVRSDIELHFIPWMANQVGVRISEIERARWIVDHVIKYVIYKSNNRSINV